MADPGKLPEKRPEGQQRHPLTSLRNEMDRLFDEFFTSPFGRRMTELSPFGRTGGMMALGDVTPNVDVRETDKEYLLEAELPGVDENDVTVEVAEGILSIRGEKKSDTEHKEEGYFLHERSYGSFERSFRIPENVQEDKIDAHFERGLLRVHMPKSGEAKRHARRINVKGSKH